MAGIDATIISNGLKPQQPRGLETVGRLQTIQQGVLQNRLLGQEVGGKEALGRAVTANTDKETGETDWDKAAADLSQDPQGAFKIPEFAASVLERKAKEIANETAKAGLTKAQLETSQAKFKAVGDWAAMVAAAGSKDPAALTPQSIIGSAKTNLLDAGFINAADESEREQLLAVMSQFGTDPKQNAEILKRVFLQSNATTEGINLALGAATQVDRGPEIVTQRTAPLTGETEVLSTMQKGRTPSETAALVQRYNPATKQMEMVPSGQIIGDMPGSAPPIAVASAPPLGVAEGASASAAGSVKQAQDLSVAADAVPAQQAALKNIRDVVDSFKPGAKTNWIYAAKALATQMGIAPPQMKDEVAAQEEFNKLATQFINQQVGALGGTGTDSKLESATKGTPNEFMSKEGIKNVTSLMMGLNDATLAKNTAWQKWLSSGNGPESYGKFASQFNAIYNPRVFQSVYMDDKQKALMLGNMTAKERTQFQKDWATAKAAGWIK